MITDRKSSDVKLAKKIIKNKVQKNLVLTEQDTETLERGTLTINTLNRIENKQMELSEILTSMGYKHDSLTHKTWNYSDVFLKSDLDRLVHNNKVLEGLLPNPTTRLDSIKRLHYSEFNALEQTLVDIESFVLNNHV